MIYDEFQNDATLYIDFLEDLEWQRKLWSDYSGFDVDQLTEYERLVLGIEK